MPLTLGHDGRIVKCAGPEALLGREQKQHCASIRLEVPWSAYSHGRGGTHRLALVIADYYYKWAEVFLLPNQEASTIFPKNCVPPRKSQNYVIGILAPYNVKVRLRSRARHKK